MSESTPLSLTFLGAAGTVTGSKHLLTVGARRILIDAGLFQGEKQWREVNWQQFPVDPAGLSDILLTHAHLDHVGFLPALVKQGFRGAVWATPDSIELSEIVLRDSAHLQEMDAEDAARGGYSKHEPPLPLYTVEDVEATLPLFRPVDFDTDVDLGDGLTVRYTRAGHILGSASINVTHGDSTVLFSGDLGRHDHPVLKPRGIPQGADYVLMESTYGDREHPEPEGLPHELFAQTIRDTVARGGSVLVPAFAIDRTEAILKTLTEMRHADRIPDVPIYVNSPMALAALKVYQGSDELRDDLRPEDFADLPNLRTVESAEESKSLNNPRFPCIIISSSGMATGGRVVHHLEHMLPDHRHSVVLTGYQGVGTRGRALLEGATQLKMHGRYVPVRAQIVQDREFSVHADCSDLLDWLRDLPRLPRTLFLVHGERDAQQALAARVQSEFGVMCVMPDYKEVVALTVGDGQDAEPGGARRQAPPVEAAPTPPAPPPTASAPVSSPPAASALPQPARTASEIAHRFARALDRADSAGMEALLADGFQAHFTDGERLDKVGFLRFLSHRSPTWSYIIVDLVDAGARVALRAEVDDGSSRYAVADFLTIAGDRIVRLDEVWSGDLSDAVATPGSPGGSDG